MISFTGSTADMYDANRKQDKSDSMYSLQETIRSGTVASQSISLN
jgi:hypothetical protein